MGAAPCYISMDSYCIYWLLDELDTLQEAGVIDSAAAGRIAAYYRGKIPATAENTPSAKAAAPAVKRRAWNVPVILSIIAAVLIAAGVISLIAYNWAAIGRGVKTLCAFVLLVSVQAGGVLLALRRPAAPRALREGIALLWALLFGAAVAFVSQIYRLPSDTCGFFFVWGASSVLLAYAMRSDTVFVLALVLSAAYCCARSTNGASVLRFYLLFASLVPYARRRKHGLYLMTVLFSVLLGFVLNHHVPGLWIPCALSLAVLCTVYGAACSERLPRISGIAGLCVLCVVLSWRGCWDVSGNPEDMRALLCSAAALPDILLALLLTAGAVFACCAAAARCCALDSFPVRWLRLLAAVPCAGAVLYVLDFFVLLDFSRAAPAYVLICICMFLVLALYTCRTPLLPVLLLCAAVFSAVLQSLAFPLAALAAAALFLEAAGRIRAKNFPGGKDAAACRLCSRTVIAACLLHAYVYGVQLPSPRIMLDAAAVLVPQLSLYALFFAAAVFVLLRDGAARHSLDVIAFGGLLCAVALLRDCSTVAALCCFRVISVLLPCAAGYAFFRWEFRTLPVCRRAFPSAGNCREYLPYLAAFVLAACRPAADSSAVFRLCALLFCSGMYCYVLHALPQSAASSTAGNFFLAASAVLLFADAFSGMDFAAPRAAGLVYLLLFAALSLYPAFRLLAARRRFNRVPSVAAAVQFTVLLLSASGAVPGNALPGKAMEHVCFVLALFLALDALYGAWKEGRVAAANAAAVYAAALVAVKFFCGNYGLLANGVLFIALGVAVLALNVCILKYGRKMQEEDSDGEA